MLKRLPVKVVSKPVVLEVPPGRGRRLAVVVGEVVNSKS